MKIVEFPISGSDYSKVVTCLRILGLALILLSGLMTLSILSAFKFMSYAINSIILNSPYLIIFKSYPNITMKKSRMFHPSRK